MKVNIPALTNQRLLIDTFLKTIGTFSFIIFVSCIPNLLTHTGQTSHKVESYVDFYLC